MRHWRSAVRISGVATLWAALSAGCSTEVLPGPSGDGGAPATGGGGEGGARGVGGRGGAGGSGGAGNMLVEVLAEFDAERGELADGLAVRGDVAFVSFAGRGEIVTVDLSSKVVEPFGSIQDLPPILSGLALSPEGHVYGAHVRCSPRIYRWPSTGGVQAAEWAQNDLDPFRRVVNDLAFDARGRLFATSSEGFLDTFDELGVPSPWLSDSALVGNPRNCANAPTDEAVGANGVAIDGDSVYVTNSNLATIERIPILSDGSAGVPVTIAGPDCELLSGVDGIALDGATLFVTVRATHSVLALDTTSGRITTVYSGAPLESPNAIGVAGDGSLIVASSAYELVPISPTGGCGFCCAPQITGRSSRLVRLNVGR